MNRGQIKSMVKRLFGDTTGTQITDSDIESWIALAELDIARRTKCLKKHAETDAVADDGAYALPPDCLVVERVTLDGLKLAKTQLEELDDIHVSDTPGSGVPSYYYIWGDTLHLYPWPASAGTGNLDIFYVYKPAEMAADVDVPTVPSQYHEDIVKYCLALAKDLDEEDSQAGILRAQYEQRLVQAKDEEQGDHQTFPAVRCLPGDYGYDWGEGY